MDITDQYLKTISEYNSSDNTSADNLSPITRLNYASGPTYGEAVEENVYTVPYTSNYLGSLGLEGVENIYVKVNHSPEYIADGVCIEEQYWECMQILDVSEPDLMYSAAVFKTDAEGDSPTYEQVMISNRFWLADASANYFMKVRLDNIGVDNIYQNTNIDTALYKAQRKPSQYKEMYVPMNGSTRFGIHSRNSKRTGLNVSLTVGLDFKKRSEMSDDDLKLLYTN